MNVALIFFFVHFYIALISSVDESTVTSQSGRGYDSAAEPVEAGCESPHRH